MIRGILRAFPGVAFGIAYVACAWVVGLLWLAILLGRGLRFVARLRRVLAPTLRCARGHAVPTYGLYRCGVCRARTESIAWRCPICRSWSGFVSCTEPSCGLAVRNPLLE